MARQLGVKPIRKVSAGAVGGATITVALWMLKSVWKVDVPAEVASALTVILTFAVSYQTPAAEDDLTPAPLEIPKAA